MRTLSTLKRLVSVSALAAMSFALLAVPAHASDEPGDPGSDVTAPGVAHISTMSGDVSIKRGDSGTTVAGAVNAPVMAGDYLTTGNDGRAEVQLDGGTLLRAGANTQIRFTQLDQSGLVTQIAAGTVMLRVLHGTDDHAIVESPSISVRPAQNGAYRVTVTDDGNTLVTVRAGDAYLDGTQSSQELGQNGTMLVSGTASAPQFRTVDTIAMDSFDQWNEQLDNAIANANNNYNYTNPNIPGENDLGAYGSWYDYPGYGYVWAPYAAPGWAPYRYGQWTWVSYYGWTWVSTEPWGWAPYHYGRWFYAADHGWSWYPGPSYVAPAWSPGIVAFFNFGNVGVGLNFGGGWGNVGWVPVGPNEPFHQWWGSGYGGSNVVINNTTNIINIYKGYGYGGGSGIGIGNWNNGQFNHIVKLPPNEPRQIGLANGRLPVAPTNHNLAFNGRAVDDARFPQARSFSTFRDQPRVNAAGSFAQQQRAVQASVPARPVATSYAGRSEANNAWNRFGPRNGDTNASRTGFTANTSRSGLTANASRSGFNTSASRSGFDTSASHSGFNTNTVRKPQVITGGSNSDRALPAHPDVWQRFGNQTVHQSGSPSYSGSARTYSGNNDPRQSSATGTRQYGTSEPRQYNTGQPRQYNSSYGQTRQYNNGYGQTRQSNGYGQAPQYNYGGQPRQYNAAPRSSYGTTYGAQPRQSTGTYGGSYGGRGSYGGGSSAGAARGGGGGAHASGGGARGGGGGHGGRG